jgi:hypothetical protein
MVIPIIIYCIMSVHNYCKSITNSCMIYLYSYVEEEKQNGVMLNIYIWKQCHNELNLWMNESHTPIQVNKDMVYSNKLLPPKLYVWVLWDPNDRNNLVLFE